MINSLKSYKPVTLAQELKSWFSKATQCSPVVQFISIMNGGALGQKFANRLFIIFRLSSKLGISNWSVFLLFGQLVQ